MSGLTRGYGGLGEPFAVPVTLRMPESPKLLVFNGPLAAALGLPGGDQPERAAAWYGGADLLPGANPAALAYAGHQFGQFVPQLGDGRAALLGEARDAAGGRWDVQLKGSGRTPFSRGGDGLAALGPVLREYLLSEAMHALGVRTTRALAAVTTGGQVLRESVLPGAVVTRVARSHIRVGTFQYLAARGDEASLKTLCAYVIERHYPACAEAECPPLALLTAVSEAQAALVSHWLSLGFIHGVMNTDNCSIAGETIDYGPCAFLDRYDPATVFSSIDRGGRYAYGNQATIAQWNLARFAETLLPLIEPGQPEAAVEAATAVIQGFTECFETRWLARFGAKLGFDGGGALAPAQVDLLTNLLSLLTQANADFTRSFRALVTVAERAAEAGIGAGETLPNAASKVFLAEFGHADERAMAKLWLADWWQCAAGAVPSGPSALADGLAYANPAVIPRNHQVEAALAAAHEGDMEPFRRLHERLAEPYAARPDDPFAEPPPADSPPYRTFCGT